MEEEARERVDRVLSDPEANEEIEERIAELEEAQEACVADPLCVPLTPREVEERIKDIKVAAYRSAFGRLYGGSLSWQMAERIVEGTWVDAPPHEKRDELIPDDRDLGCLVRRTAAGQRTLILAEAERLARLNGADLEPARVRLIDDQGQNYVEVSRSLKPPVAAWLFPEHNYPKLVVSNRVHLQRVGTRTPQYSPGC